MAPASDRRSSRLSSFLASRKNIHPFHSSSIYHSFLFCCDRFREVFKIPDFDAHEFDTALQLEAENYRAGTKAIHSADILVKLFISFAKPFAKVSVNNGNYNEHLHNIFDRRLVTEERKNPLGEYAETANIHSLPNEVKIYLLDFLLNQRIHKDESETVDRFCDASALRVLELGEDTSGNNYFYFCGFRVVVELKKHQQYSHPIDALHLRNAAWTQYYEEYIQNSQFLIAAENKEQWTAITDILESSGSNEKKMARAIKNLYKHELEAHLADVQKREQKQVEELKAMQKSEIQMRRELGQVRTSGRLQVKELERKQKEEEDRKIREEEERREMERAIANGSRLPSHFVAKPLTRDERRQHREALIAERMLHETNEINFTEDSSQPSISNASYSHEEASNLETCESSLSSMSSFASLKRPAASVDGSDDFDDVPHAKRACNEEEMGSGSEKESDDKMDPLPFYAKPSYLCHLTMERYYTLFSPRESAKQQQQYRMALHTAQVLFASEFRPTYSKHKAENDEWPEFATMLNKLEHPEEMRSRIDLVLHFEQLVLSTNDDAKKAALVNGMLTFAEMSWDHLFPTTSEEDLAAKEIMRQLHQRVQGSA